VVRVGRVKPRRDGEESVSVGEHTHFFDGSDVICRSGAHFPGERKFFPAYAQGNGPGTVDTSRAATVTCYRCAKLGSFNVAQGRNPWQGP